MLEETSLQLMRTSSNGTETWALTSQDKNKFAATQTEMERSMLNITYRDRKTNVWIRQKTNVTEQVTYGRGQGTSVEYEVTDGHRISPPGIPGNHTKGNDLEEKQWTDELDEYWQRTAQDRQLWKQHDDDFTQLLDTMEAQ